MAPCPDDETLAALVDGSLSDSERQNVLDHMEGCESCVKLLGVVLGASGSGDENERSVTDKLLPPGEYLGRYQIQRLIGAGAMGVVYAAYDPELARRVAIKLLRTDRNQADKKLHQRLLWEARSLARLAHPNVVGIYDVGTISHSVFLAMEYIEGGTLGTWLHEKKRSVDIIFDALLQAGEGISAAHKVGIVHRDIKPDNVLVGLDGRVRVGDFGLAREENRHGETEQPSLSATLRRGSEIGARTRTGALVGTPAYMAPEQAAGGISNALSDQYSFCLVCVEAFTGTRPTPDTLSTSLRRLPGYVRPVLQKGLSATPSERWGTMQDLLFSLKKAKRSHQFRPWFALVLLVLCGLVLGGVFLTKRARPSCDRGESLVAQSWSTTHRTQLHTLFEQTKKQFGEDSFLLIDKNLSDYKTALIGGYNAACEDTWVKGIRSEVSLDQRTRCLDDRRRSLDNLVDLLTIGDGATLSRALDATLKLALVADCANSRAWQGAESRTVTPEAAVMVASIDNDLARGEALMRTGQLQASKELLSGVRGKLTEGIPKENHIKQRLLEAEVTSLFGDAQAATLLYHEAASMATAAGSVVTQSDAWIAIVESEARAHHLDSAATAALHARACITLLGGDPTREVKVQWAQIIATGKYGDDLEKELSMLQTLKEYVQQNPVVGERWFAHVDDEIGNNLFHRGQYEQAIVHYDAALARKQRVYGFDNRTTWVSRHNRAEALTEQGELPKAIEAFEFIFASAEGYFALEDRFALALRKAGRIREAMMHDRRGIELCDLGGGVSCSVTARLGLIEDYLALNDLSPAVPLAQEMIALDAPLIGYDRADVLFAAAKVFFDAGVDKSRARTLAQQARNLAQPWAKKYGGPHGARLVRIDQWLEHHGLPPR